MWSDMAGSAVHVVSLGACTPIGRDTLSACAAVRAGISGFSEHPYMVDVASKPMRAAIATWLDIGLSGTSRLEHLLFPAIDEAMAPLVARLEQLPRMAIALALPAPRPGVSATLESEMSSLIRQRYGSIFPAAASFPNGHAGGLLALNAALLKLKQGVYEACIVAGVDSYLEPEALEWLDQNDQLHGAGLLNNAWGFVPGEAAGALLMMTAAAARQFGLPSITEVLAVGLASEEMRIKTETVCIGAGLTEAFRQAFAATPGSEKVTDVYCDMNGEPYRADEFGFATVRTAASFVDSGVFVAPADCWGDVGAASGPLLACLSAVACRKGYARGSRSLVWASSEGGERAAAVFQA